MTEIGTVAAWRISNDASTVFREGKTFFQPGLERLAARQVASVPGEGGAQSAKRVGQHQAIRRFRFASREGLLLQIRQSPPQTGAGDAGQNAL
jgi:hypothetical protein